MRNALTIDLEDYFQVVAFANGNGAGDWDTRTSRVEANTFRLLDILAANQSKATFFTVGWIAEKFPNLIRRIAEFGHEIACHSYYHRLVYSLTPPEFTEDTRRAKQVLEQATGVSVRGYRAPSFSITPSIPWAFDILVQLGFTYDSSIFPIKHIEHGMPRGPRFAFRLQTPSGPIVEFPMPTLSFAGVRAPFGGGAYFRFLPYRFTRWGIRYVNQVENHAVCVYLHPWELDTAQPPMKGSFTARTRHYWGLQQTENKLKRLLADVDFSPLGSVIDGLTPGLPVQAVSLTPQPQQIA